MSKFGLKASLLGLETSCLEYSPPSSKNYITLTSLVSPIPSHLPNNIPAHVAVTKCASHPSASDPISLLDLHWLFLYCS